MAKYVFLPGPAYGHVNPTLAVAQELVRRGEQVVYYGVPVVVVPQMREQEVTAQRCAELGLGIALDPNDLTAEKLRAAVEYVHHTPTFGEHVRAMQQTMRAAGGYQRAVDTISHFASIQK